MGYLKTIPIDTLPLPSNPEYHVRMRARATAGIVRAAQTAMIHVDTTYADPATGKPLDKAQAITTTEWGAYTRELAFGLLVDWNLTDDNDQPLPLTRENLDLLEPEDGQFLDDEAAKRAKLRSGPAEQDFTKPSS